MHLAPISPATGALMPGSPSTACAPSTDWPAQTVWQLQRILGQAAIAQLALDDTERMLALMRSTCSGSASIGSALSSSLRKPGRFMQTIPRSERRPNFFLGLFPEYRPKELHNRLKRLDCSDRNHNPTLRLRRPRNTDLRERRTQQGNQNCHHRYRKNRNQGNNRD